MALKQRIWVDADACPNVIKEILFRVALRCEVQVILVANQMLRTPKNAFVRAIQVEQGFDVADNYIATHCDAEDLVITADIPLAADVIAYGAKVLGPRGQAFTKDNIKQRLTMRNFMEEMRSSGENIGGPPPISAGDCQQFGNAIDKIVSQWQRHAKS